MSHVLLALLAAAPAMSAGAQQVHADTAQEPEPTGQSAPASEPGDAAAVSEEQTDSPAAPSEPKEDSISLLGARFSLVAGAAMLWPTSRVIRDDYGSSHPSLSIGFWSFRARRGFGASLDAGWRAFGRDETGEVNLWNVNLGAVWLSRPRTRDLIPYLSLRAGPQLVKIPDRDLRFALGGTLEAGVVLWRRLIVSGRWDLLTRTADLDLSNLSARIAIRVF